MDTEETLWYEGERLRVNIASPSYVLAMKLFAARTTPTAADVEDVARLMSEYGLSTSEQLREIADDIHCRGLSATRYLPERLSLFCDLAAAKYRELYEH